MNERIRELAEQAGDYVNSVYNPPVRSSTPGKIWEDGHVDWHTQFNQKFAELIVRECALTLESITVPVLDYNPDFDNGYNKALLTGSTVIKKHFGVEE